MTTENRRAETARRHDDSSLIGGALDTPPQGGRSGGDLQRDIGTKADEEYLIDGKPGVTRVRKDDEQK